MGGRREVSRMRKNLTEIAISGVVVVTAWLAYEQAVTKSRELAPATDWFEVYEIVIPDFTKGTDPDVLYRRAIKQDFSGSWTVTIFKKDDPGVVACRGSGEARYRTSTKLPNERMPLSDFADPGCVQLPFGCYYGHVHWDISPDGYPAKDIEYEIATFCVRPANSPLL